MKTLYLLWVVGYNNLAIFGSRHFAYFLGGGYVVVRTGVYAFVYSAIPYGTQGAPVADYIIVFTLVAR